MIFVQILKFKPLFFDLILNSDRFYQSNSILINSITAILIRRYSLKKAIYGYQIQSIAKNEIVMTFLNFSIVIPSKAKEFHNVLTNSYNAINLRQINLKLLSTTST
jgi:hypothetical protein